MQENQDDLTKRPYLLKSIKLLTKDAGVNVFYIIGMEQGPGVLPVEISPASGIITGRVGICWERSSGDDPAAVKPVLEIDASVRGDAG